MRFSSSALAVAAAISYCSAGSLAFAPSSSSIANRFNSKKIGQSSRIADGNTSATKIFATVEDEKTKAEEKAAADGATGVEIDPDAEGLPWWWELVWKLDIMQTGEPGTDCTFGDSANVLRTNIEQIYGGYPSLDGCPLAEGDIADIADGTQFIGLQSYYNTYGSPYKLCFGPKSFLVISDPVQAKHILKVANKQYDKGLLAGKCTLFSPPLHI